MEVLPRLGRWIAALAGACLVASLFVDWYGKQIICIQVVGFPCPQPGVSGWEALEGGDLLLVAAAALGTLPLLLGLAWRPAARPAAAVALLAGLLAALLVVRRISVVPGAPGLEDGSARLAGPFLALAAALALAGGAMLAAAGDRLLQRTRAAAPLTATATGAGVLVASIFLPWIDAAAFGRTVANADGGGLSAWEAFRVADVLLVVVGLALLTGVALAGVLRWRVLHLVLALGGWLGAAIAVFATPRPIALGGGIVEGEVGAGYHLCLAACATIVLAGVWAGAGPSGCTRRPLTADPKDPDTHER